MSEGTTWRKEIADAMGFHGETWDDVVSCVILDGDWDKEFDDGFGLSEGSSFTVWTANRVYFPVTYDGSESVGDAGRS